MATCTHVHRHLHTYPHMHTYTIKIKIWTWYVGEYRRKKREERANRKGRTDF